MITALKIFVLLSMAFCFFCGGFCFGIAHCIDKVRAITRRFEQLQDEYREKEIRLWVHAVGPNVPIWQVPLRIRQEVKKRVAAVCPHGHLNWDDCPVCGH